MSDLTKFSEGASILQQVDVSDIFTNLAMGIAEAQQKLDDNSIAQAIKLAETNIDGESLLSLGFAPVFYAFQYADISASINLRMGLKEALEFGFGLDVQLANQKGYTSASRTFLSSNSYSETSEEYKSVRQLNFRAKEKKAIKINNKFVSQSEYLDSKSRLEDFKHKIQTEASVDQVYEEIQSRTLTENKSRGVDVWIDGGFIRIEPSLHFGGTAKGVGVLKITDFNAPTISIDLDGPTPTAATPFNLPTAFDNTLLNNAVTGAGAGAAVYALTKGGTLHMHDGTGWMKISSKFYFPYNSDKITYNEDLKLPAETSVLDYNTPYEAPTTAVDNQNYPEHKLIHKVLRLIQSHDSGASITITGMTDPKGGDNPKNRSLAKRRAEKLCNHIFGSSAPVNVEIGAITNTAGPSNLLQRNATIELDADYLIVIGGNVKKEATPTTGVNKFVYADDSTAPGGVFTSLDVQYGSISLVATNSDFTEIWNSAKIKLTNHKHEETTEGFHYSLDNEAIVKLHLLSNAAEEITIEENSESGIEGSENQSSYLWAKTKSESATESESSSNTTQSKSFAFGASVDFRMSRQFEMSMEGNSSMSARLVSLPAPDAFRAFLDRKYGSSTEE
ncbi:MAG: OmpA family protein [Fluviicola sp.]|jgi:hypothetical protein|uniref:hypothetical protein n=1 Tax=Fluviicola sp. TaxID=1917219 RepID=UPI0026283DE6|nr:hypothetical protein [Fluviicola sp.]MDF3027628.1 OmpA family protein [Fluviicola sp.]